MPLVTAMRLKEERGKSQVPEAIQCDEKSKASLNEQSTDAVSCDTPHLEPLNSTTFPGSKKGLPFTARHQALCNRESVAL